MVMSTFAGHLILIHDLDLSTFEQDFRHIILEELYHQSLVQDLTKEKEDERLEVEFESSADKVFTSKSPEQEALCLQALTRKKNRVEFLFQQHLLPGRAMSLHFDPFSRYLLAWRTRRNGDESLIYDLAREEERNMKLISEFSHEYCHFHGLNYLDSSADDERHGLDEEKEEGEEQKESRDYSEDIKKDQGNKEDKKKEEHRGKKGTNLPWNGPERKNYFREFPIYPSLEIRSQFPFDSLPVPSLVHLAFRRQVCYMQEGLFSAGFFKGPCWSNCGRFTCSPYHRGVRIFDHSLLEGGLPFPQKVAKTFEDVHQQDVLTVAFSPTLPQIASGGHDGRVCLYSPYV